MLNRLGALAFALLAASAVQSSAEEYPTRPVTIIVPFAAGGPFDIIGREVAEALSQRLPRRFMIENRAGAGGATGTQYVMAAKPDGYTLLLGSPGPLVIAPSAQPGTLDVDGKLQAVGIIAESPQVLVVNAKLAVNSIADLVAMAKSKPGAMNYGSAGIGTTPHLSAEMFKNVAGIDILHVPFRGTAAAIQDAVRGDVAMLFGDVSTLRPFINDNRVKALAVTSAKRTKLLPDVPTTREAGFPNLIVRNFSVLLAPAQTPKSVVAVLSKALEEAKGEASFVERLDARGMATVATSPEHARDYLRAERELWAPLVKSVLVKP
jgi:tripartite-type tricarboxylate transporter receptor subunit TctC